MTREDSILLVCVIVYAVGAWAIALCLGYANGRRYEMDGFDAMCTLLWPIMFVVSLGLLFVECGLWVFRKIPNVQRVLRVVGYALMVFRPYRLGQALKEWNRRR